MLTGRQPNQFGTIDMLTEATHPAIYQRTNAATTANHTPTTHAHREKRLREKNSQCPKGKLIKEGASQRCNHFLIEKETRV